MDQTDKLRQQAALGYIQLGLPGEAISELDGLSAPASDAPDTLVLRLEALHALNRWPEAITVSSQLMRLQPDEAGWPVMLAYATRRHESIEDAREILLEAHDRHPNEATIPFNLACYACQLGDLDRARTMLARAFTLDESFIKLAHDDEDLDPIKPEISGIARGARART